MQYRSIDCDAAAAAAVANICHLHQAAAAIVRSLTYCRHLLFSELALREAQQETTLPNATVSHKQDLQRMVLRHEPVCVAD